MRILVINAGSSSVKYEWVDTSIRAVLMEGSLEGIGEGIGESRHRHTDHPSQPNPAGQQPGPTNNPNPPVLAETVVWQGTTADHKAAFERIFSRLEQTPGGLERLEAIGHRVVHGGERFTAPARITPSVEEAIEATIPLAPLHNPSNLLGIRAARHLLPGLPQVAVFDTAFHHTLPPHAFAYAVPREWAQNFGVRRYGFHGTSHRFVAGRAARLMGRPEKDLRLITLHLGNGASAAAIRGGVCLDTSMGLTPLEGLVMGTRPGDTDPALPFYMGRVAGLSSEEMEEALTRHSGLKGLCGHNDMRAVHRAADGGDPAAGLARDMFAYRIKKYIGAYMAVLGGADGVVFTGGIGQHDPWTRREVCRGMEALGMLMDETANGGHAPPPFGFHLPESPVQLWVIPTHEELEIALQTAALLVGPRE